MSIGTASTKGLVAYDPWKVYQGVNLLTPAEGTGVWLVDMQGRYVHYWEAGCVPSCGAELLLDGNLLYAGKQVDGPLADLEGAAGVLLELDWFGKCLWRHEDPYLHHGFARSANGNTYVTKWTEIPARVTSKVEGGIEGSERSGKMWGDVIQEVDQAGRVVWEWLAHEHLDPTIDVICPICRRSTWPHTNSIHEMADGNLLVSFMRTSTVAKIDRASGDVLWRWGKGQLAHQHFVTEMDNGNVLVFDRGLHTPGMDCGYSQVIELSPQTGEKIWVYMDGHFFFSSILSSCQRLPNGNTLICEGAMGRLFEVDAKGTIVWEYLNNLPSEATSPVAARHCMVHAAFRYGVDFAGLRRPVLVPRQRQATPGTATGVATRLHSRLEALGY